VGNDLIAKMLREKCVNNDIKIMVEATLRIWIKYGGRLTLATAHLKNTLLRF
jgi:hypothetical protein